MFVANRFIVRALGTLVSALVIAGCGGSTPAGPSNDGSTDGSALPPCMYTPVMPATTFCQIFIPSCGTARGGYTSMNECVATYGALTTTKPMRQACQSRHLCQALEYPVGAERDLHCGHATGFPGNQECEQPD
jgi:hypothetical protein